MKKWSLETLVRQLDAWTMETYGETVLHDASPINDKPLGEVIEDFKKHDFSQRLIVQVPGQTKIKADPAGNVEVVEDGEDTDPGPVAWPAGGFSDEQDVRG